MSFFDLFRKNRQNLREIEELSASINALSVDEARRRADIALRNEGKFRLAPLGGPLPEWVQGMTREFFLTYGNVVGVQTETELGLSLMGDSTGLPPFKRIGTDLDATEIVVVPGSDRIYQVDGSEDVVAGAPICEPEPTIYHYIVMSDVMANRDVA